MHSSFKFVTGMTVAHVTSLSLKMKVKELKYKYEKEDENDPKSKKIKYFEGIEVTWDHNGDIKTDKFHSALLVPWDVAKMGEQVVDEWLADNNKPQYKKIYEMTRLANQQADTIAQKYI